MSMEYFKFSFLFSLDLFSLPPFVLVIPPFAMMTFIHPQPIPRLMPELDTHSIDSESDGPATPIEPIGNQGWSAAAAQICHNEYSVADEYMQSLYNAQSCFNYGYDLGANYALPAPTSEVVYDQSSPTCLSTPAASVSVSNYQIPTPAVYTTSSTTLPLAESGTMALHAPIPRSSCSSVLSWTPLATQQPESPRIVEEPYYTHDADRTPTSQSHVYTEPVAQSQPPVSSSEHVYPPQWHSQRQSTPYHGPLQAPYGQYEAPLHATVQGHWQFIPGPQMVPPMAVQQYLPPPSVMPQPQPWYMERALPPAPHVYSGSEQQQLPMASCTSSYCSTSSASNTTYYPPAQPHAISAPRQSPQHTISFSSPGASQDTSSRKRKRTASMEVDSDDGFGLSIANWPSEKRARYNTAIDARRKSLADYVGFLPTDPETLSQQDKKRAYVKCMEEYIEFLHEQIRVIGHQPVPLKKIEAHDGMNTRSVRTIAAYMQHTVRKAHLQVLSEERTFIERSKMLEATSINDDVVVPTGSVSQEL